MITRGLGGLNLVLRGLDGLLIIVYYEVKRLVSRICRVIEIHSKING